MLKAEEKSAVGLLRDGARRENMAENGHNIFPVPLSVELKEFHEYRRTHPLISVPEPKTVKGICRKVGLGGRPRIFSGVLRARLGECISETLDT